jgi:histidine ammonia-lyase
VTPVVPARGSLGASGDLAPLAHIGLVLIGEGEATLDGERLPGGAALERAGLSPITLAAKEGLAIVNGTHLMAAAGALAIHDAHVLVESAEVAAAMSLEALRGTDVPFDARIQAIRRQAGQVETAAHMRALLAGSAIIPSHRTDDPRVQDPYTLRCIPQVIGAVRDTVAHCTRIVEAELSAVTDNPLCFPEDHVVLSGGNFHGQPIALALDILAIALAELAAFGERRTYLLLDDREPRRDRLPAFLAHEPGLNSGYMLAQYTAAALVGENAVLATPAGLHSVPTSAGMEDFVSMGATAATKLRTVLRNAEHVVAIELLCAAEGVEYRRPLQAGTGVEEALRHVRAIVPPMERDRSLHPDIAALAAALHEGRFAL